MFTFSKYITIVLLALLGPFLQNKCAHGGNTIFKSQWRNNGYSRILSESFFKKMRRYNALSKDRDYVEGHDITNESKYNHSDCSETNLTVFLDDACESECGSIGESENEFECKSQYESMCEVNKPTTEHEEFFNGRKNDNICNRESQQHHYNEKCSSYNNSEEEKHHVVHEMYNNGINEKITTHDERFESCQSLISEYPESEESFMCNSKNIKTSEDEKMDSASFREHKKSYGKSNMGSNISINDNYSLSNENFNASFRNISNMVHNTDILKIFSLYNMQERIKLFNSLHSLMIYWNELSSSSGIPDEYKNRQWLKVYNIVTEKVGSREEVFYKKLGLFLSDTWCSKKAYDNFIRKVKFEWDEIHKTVDIGMKGYLKQKAWRYVRII